VPITPVDQVFVWMLLDRREQLGAGRPNQSLHGPEPRIARLPRFDTRQGRRRHPSRSGKLTLAQVGRAPQRAEQRTEIDRRHAGQSGYLRCTATTTARILWIRLWMNNATRPAPAALANAPPTPAGLEAGGGPMLTPDGIAY